MEDASGAKGHAIGVRLRVLLKQKPFGALMMIRTAKLPESYESMVDYQERVLKLTTFGSFGLPSWMSLTRAST